jgi:hypothetical protein
MMGSGSTWILTGGNAPWLDRSWTLLTTDETSILLPAKSTGRTNAKQENSPPVQMFTKLPF